MADLFFPQLASGAVAQYPIQKTVVERTVKNAMADGTVWTYADAGARRKAWQLRYVELDEADMLAFSNFFDACQGRLHGFTFIDPTENMLANSGNLLANSWQAASWIEIAPGAADPNGGTKAFVVTNSGQVDAQIFQAFRAPAGYQYCFSVYAAGNGGDSIRMVRQGAADEDATVASIGADWTRVVSGGRLNDSGNVLSVGIQVAAGQQVTLYGPQLEAQAWPSRYRPTTQQGGVYRNAHWATDQFEVALDAPGRYSTVIGLEAVD